MKTENYTYKKQDDHENPSHYILSNEDMNAQEADEALEELAYDAWEEAKFVEFDSAVAQHYGYKNCAIFHIPT